MSNGQRGTKSGKKPLPLKWQVVVMITFLAGILASHYMSSYAGNFPHGEGLLQQAYAFTDWSWRYWLSALIVTLAAFPTAYEKALEIRDSPSLVQVGVVFVTGVGWNTVLDGTVQHVPHLVGGPAGIIVGFLF